MDLTLFSQMLINGLISGFLYVLIALGLTLIFGIMSVINFAHGQLYMLGGFFLWWFFTILNINYVLSILLAVIVVGGIGWLVERFLVRPLRTDDPLFVLCIMVALGLFLEFVAREAWGPLDKAIPTVLPGLWRFGGVVISFERLLAVVVGIALVVGLYLFINRTRAGLAMRAVEQDAEIATMYGMGIDRTHALCFTIGAVLAAASGGLTGTILFISPTMGMAPMMKAFIIIIVGGMGSVPGAIVGGLIIGLLDSFVGTLFGIDVSYMVGFAVVLMVLIFRPKGLFGRA